MTKSTKSVVIITGVSSGIGLAAARIFSEHGWIVVGTVRSRGKAAAVRDLRIDTQLADMLKPGDIERVIKTAQQTYGRIDAVICNAGYGLIGPIETLEYSAMQEQLAVNVLAPAALARAVAPVMRAQHGGAIVSVSSIVGRVGLPSYSLYVASKFGLEGLMESLSMELASDGIRVKLVEPSSVRTRFWTALRGSGAKNEAGRGGSAGSLTPEAVAATVYRAATDSSPRLRYPIGQTRMVSVARRLLPDRTVLGIVKKMFERS